MQPDQEGEEDGEVIEEYEDWSVVGLAPNGDPDEEVIEITPEQAGGVPYRKLKRDQPPPGGGG